MMKEDTISAVATAAGEGGIGIVRLSGPRAAAAAARIFRPAGGKKLLTERPRQALYGHIVDPDDGRVVDEVLLLYMRAPHSYTKEDVVEIHCHGGMTPLRSILDLTLAGGARLAEPGEFTKRAFLNGRLDLTQAEAVIDVIRAKTDASLKMASSQLSGRLASKIRSYRREMLGMIAQLEAAIDFPEDEIDELAAAAAHDKVRELQEKITALLASARTGKILRDGLETVIIGKPNVGKSSLLNALLRESRAIVTDIPGTTRDSIEEYVNVGGVPLKIIDTAGIRATDDAVEKLGVDKTRELITRAGLILALFDLAAPLTAEDEEILELAKDRRTIVVLNKADLEPVLDTARIEAMLPGRPLLRLSAARETGLLELEQTIVALAYEGAGPAGETLLIHTARQVDLLRQAKCLLNETLTTIERGLPPDFVVIDLRSAWEKLGELTGETVGEDIIEQIFTQFCIGK